jgi:hypothetical protein
VEDRDEKTGSDPEIEAHRRGRGPRATDEAPEGAAATGETTDEDEPDVELHKFKKSTK